MTIINDLLLFFSASFVFSITVLCILLQVRAHDRYSRDFLTILVPLLLQMGLVSIVSYLDSVLPDKVISGEHYSIFALTVTLFSIIATSVILYNFSRYLINLLPIKMSEKRKARIILNLLAIVFFFLSLFFINLKSRGNWFLAMELTLHYHFAAGSFLYVIHGITTLFYIKN